MARKRSRLKELQRQNRILREFTDWTARSYVWSCTCVDRPMNSTRRHNESCPVRRARAALKEAS